MVFIFHGSKVTFTCFYTATKACKDLHQCFLFCFLAKFSGWKSWICSWCKPALDTLHWMASCLSECRPPLLQVMLAASYWSLLAPAIEMAEASEMYGSFCFLPISLGFVAGGVFVYLADLMLPILVINFVLLPLQLSYHNYYNLLIKKECFTLLGSFALCGRGCTRPAGRWQCTTSRPSRLPRCADRGAITTR